MAKYEASAEELKAQGVPVTHVQWSPPANGDAKLVQEVIPDGFMGHTGQNPFKQDIAKAKEYLAKTQWPNGGTRRLWRPCTTSANASSASA